MMLADRTQERERFHQFLKTSAGCRILLIHAPSGYGKTWVLSEFKLCCPPTHQCFSIDLRTTEQGILNLILQLSQKIDDQHFQHLKQELSLFLRQDVEICGNRISGEGNLIQVLQNASDEGQRTVRVEQLQTAFFRDIKKLKQPIVLLLDHFEEAPREVQSWVGDRLLAEVTQLKQCFVVVAGTNIPTPMIDWLPHHEVIQLEPILDMDAWHRYFRFRGMSYQPSEIRLLIQHLRGVPAEVTAAFAGLPKERSQ